MKKNIGLILIIAALVICSLVELFLIAHTEKPKKNLVPHKKKPALVVTTTSLKKTKIPIYVTANGHIMAWQEAIIGAETNGLRLTEVRVNVGDKVKRGQELATFASEMINADLTDSSAAVTEAEAMLSEAEVNAQRAHALQNTGTLSQQQIQKFLTIERSSKAKLEASLAIENKQKVRLLQTKVFAPDDGVISSRTATVGAVLPTGAELFRLIRQSRLEWRAEVSANDIPRLRKGLVVSVIPNGGPAFQSRLRAISPKIDVLTGNAMVYVDVPPHINAYAGMFAHGEFVIKTDDAFVLPAGALQMRENTSYVTCVGPDLKVFKKAVTTGKLFNGQIEIVAGITPDLRVVQSGGAFLNQGDTVKVVDAQPQLATLARQ